MVSACARHSQINVCVCVCVCVLDSRKRENVFGLVNTHHLNIRATVWLVWEALFSFTTAPHQNNAGKRCNQEYRNHPSNYCMSIHGTQVPVITVCSEALVSSAETDLRINRLGQWSGSSSAEQCNGLGDVRLWVRFSLSLSLSLSLCVCVYVCMYVCVCMCVGYIGVLVYGYGYGYAYEFIGSWVCVTSHIT